MAPGHVARNDYEFRRGGTSNLFMLFAPLEGWRHVEVTKRRTAIDYARVLKKLAEEWFVEAGWIILVHPFQRMQAFACRAAHGGNRTGRAKHTMPEPAYPGRTNSAP